MDWKNTLTGSSFYVGVSLFWSYSVCSSLIKSEVVILSLPALSFPPCCLSLKMFYNSPMCLLAYFPRKAHPYYSHCQNICPKVFHLSLSLSPQYGQDASDADRALLLLQPLHWLYRLRPHRCSRRVPAFSSGDTPLWVCQIGMGGDYYMCLNICGWCDESWRC